MITYNKETNIIHLQTKDTSYVIEILKNKYPMQLYYGKRLERYIKHMNNIPFFYKDGWKGLDIDEYDMSLDSAQLAWEFPCFGRPDTRIPAFCAEYENGGTVTDFQYESHSIYKGKKPLCGLPATYVEIDDEADTLEITLADTQTGVKAVLSYSVFEEYDAITKSVKIINGGNEKVNIKTLMSATVHMFDKDFEYVHLTGAWAREAHIERQPLMHGIMTVDSKYAASGHHHSPFLTLARPHTTETDGEVYGFSLVYSGNHIEQAETNYFDIVRVCVGINPFGFEWLLSPNEEFQAPEVVLTYSDRGFGKMSETYHKLYRNRLCRGKYRDAERPVLLNSWEAYYCNIDEEKLLNLAKKAKKLNMDMVVLDDGWFGRGSSMELTGMGSSILSLGDWYPDKTKFPNGISGVADKIDAMGLKFGIWFEPEMMSVKSELFKKHPEWCIHAPNKLQSPVNNRYLMDLSRPDVCDFIYETISGVLKSAKVSYVKWDYNRAMTDFGSEHLPQERQQELSHRYVLGLYSVLERLTSEFPDVLFEGCASGGGRLDPGMMYYFSQYWTSDCTDAVERMYIQHGMSMFVPSVFMSAHVSDVPNHQLGRITPLNTRGNIAMAGQFGYELDLNNLTEEEEEKVREQIKLYKSIGKTIHNGTMYRLKSPFEGRNVAWEYADEDTVVLIYATTTAKAAIGRTQVRLRGLDENAKYTDEKNDVVYDGDYLMNVGLYFNDDKDAKSELVVLKKV